MVEFRDHRGCLKKPPWPLTRAFRNRFCHSLNLRSSSCEVRTRGGEGCGTGGGTRGCGFGGGRRGSGGSGFDGCCGGWWFSGG